MATKMKRLSLHLRTFLLLIWTIARGGDGYSCPYGQICSFEPAPPGKAPPCAQPGLTYCVHPDPYPDNTDHHDCAWILSSERKHRNTFTEEPRFFNHLAVHGDYSPQNITSANCPGDYSPQATSISSVCSSIKNIDSSALMHRPRLACGLQHIIRKLIEAGQYDIRTLLSDESRDDFSSRKSDYPYGYGPNSLPHVDQISLVNEVFPKNYNTKFLTRYNHDIYSQKTPLQPPSPVDPSPYNINAYQATQNISKFGFHGYQTSPGYWSPNQYDNYDKKVFRNTNLGGYNHNLFDNTNFYPNYDSSDWFRQAAGGVTQYNPNEWWKYISPSRSDVTVERSVSLPPRTTHMRRSVRKKRNAELVKAASKRPLSGAEALRIALGLASAETQAESSAERPRRQTGNTMELCRTRTEFITPRAALNNKGSWRYVVNMPDNMTQLVRAEICTSTECNGICSVPLGYTSRCEQKYIQKRLVALEATGQNLYTDLFWIPSCCQCTFVNNN